MAYATVHNVIRTRFNSQITTGQSITTAWDNVAMDSPPASTTGKWVRFSVRGGETQQLDMGPSGTHRTVGVATAQVFTPADRGDKLALEVVDLIVAAFRGVSVTESGAPYQTESA